VLKQLLGFFSGVARTPPAPWLVQVHSQHACRDGDGQILCLFVVHGCQECLCAGTTITPSWSVTP
jgi:hypothetical protein